MAGRTRQRTAAQRKPKPEDNNETIKPAEILDEQAQDQEIQVLRAQNASSNAQAHNALDVGIVTCLFISIIQFTSQLSDSNPTLAIIALLQTLMLPFSLTPHWLGWLIPPKSIPEDTHLYLLSIHLAISGCGIYLCLFADGLGLADLSQGLTIPFNEIARWALPSLAVLGVEMQRRAERTAEEKIRLLEGLKYDLKGA